MKETIDLFNASLFYIQE